MESRKMKTDKTEFGKKLNGIWEKLTDFIGPYILNMSHVDQLGFIFLIPDS